MMNTASDLQGNIRMAGDLENGANAIGNALGMGGAQAAAQRPGGVPPEFRGLNTLDEPVCDTIVSPLKIYYHKWKLAAKMFSLSNSISPNK